MLPVPRAATPAESREHDQQLGQGSSRPARRRSCAARGDGLDVGPDVQQVRADPRWPAAAAGHQGDQRGGDPAARMTARMIQTAVWWPPEPDGAWKDPAAKGKAIRNSRPLTVQLAVVAIAPALTAAAASYPWRWKNLTRTAKTATSPPTSAVKVFDVSSATQRPNGSWPVAAPAAPSLRRPPGVGRQRQRHLSPAGALDGVQGVRRRTAPR